MFKVMCSNCLTSHIFTKYGMTLSNIHIIKIGIFNFNIYIECKCGDIIQLSMSMYYILMSSHIFHITNNDIEVKNGFYIGYIGA